MVSMLWTAVVRAVAVATAALAVAVIVTPLVAARAESGTAGPPLGEVLGETERLQPVAAAQPAPAETVPVPAGALPATRASTLSLRPTASEEGEAESLPARPLVAVIDVAANPAAELAEGFALLVKERLESRGHAVYLIANGAEAADGPGAGAEPLRPDAYVSLRAVAADRQMGMEAWFCEVEGSLSGRLADFVQEGALAGLAALQGTSAPGDGSVEDPEAFRCDVLLAGRAHMPTVLLELPDAALSEPSVRESTGQGIAGAIDRFFSRHRTTLLREGQRRSMEWPAFGPITSHFGPSHPLGIDIGQWEGHILAATDGEVLFAGGDPCCSYGLFVVIESPAGIYTVYGHLDSLIVRSGERVRQGQPLGIVGCTGHCSGPHLHFEVIEGGVRRDPLTYLP